MDNIILQDVKREIIKIVDFGLGNAYSESDPLKTLCGSPEYAAPELFVQGQRYGPEIDLWSLGIVLYAMGTGRLPFLATRDAAVDVKERRRQLMLLMNRGLGPEHDRAIAALSADFKNLVRGLLTPVALERVRMPEVLVHSWFRRPIGARDNETSGKLGFEERDAVLSEVVRYTKLSRGDVEAHVADSRFDSIHGMYNIVTHGIQQNGLKSNFKKDDVGELDLNSNICGNEKNQTSTKQSKSKSVGTKSIKDSFSIAEYDRETKALRSLRSRPKILVFEPRTCSGSRDTFMDKRFNSLNSKPKEVRPKTISCSKPAVTYAPSCKCGTARPSSEISKSTLQRESKPTQKPQKIHQKPSTILPQSKSDQPSAATNQIDKWTVVRFKNKPKKKAEITVVKEAKKASSSQSKPVKKEARDSRLSKKF